MRTDQSIYIPVKFANFWSTKFYVCQYPWSCVSQMLEFESINPVIKKLSIAYSNSNCSGFWALRAFVLWDQVDNYALLYLGFLFLLNFRSYCLHVQLFRCLPEMFTK